MASSTSNPAHARSRSLRPNSLKPSSLNPQPIALPPGPSNAALFLTNLRLLELDLRDDWPDITATTFSTSTRQENQKKRLHCAEWALYYLFALWDPEETRNKLQPFFPPLDPLQSLNLRAALFRCLDQVKKNGVLGRDTVLRKTMLDDCKGGRFEEVMATFSNAVLKKVLQEGGSDHHEAIAHQLAYEKFSYTGDRTVISALILAYKVSLGTHIRAKRDLRGRYRDFSSLLDLHDRRLIRRQEQLKEIVAARDPQENLSKRETHILLDQVERNWSGSDEWLKAILHGDSRFSQDGLMATPFEQVWKHVNNSSIGDVEGKHRVGLLEQLDARIRDQESRLARWQEFGRSLSNTSPGSFRKKPIAPRETKIDLGFNLHQDLQVGGTNVKATGTASVPSLNDYTRLIENMKAELSEVGKPLVPNTRHPKQHSRPEESLRNVSSPPSSQPEALGKDEEWSSTTDSEEPSPGFNEYAAKSTSQTPPSEILPGQRETEESVPDLPTKAKMLPPAPKATTTRRPEDASKAAQVPAPIQKQSFPSPKSVASTSPPIEIPKLADSESDLADQILSSMSTASPSPKKQRHTLSLAERTRLSMARTSHSQHFDMHNDYDNITDLPQLSIRPKPTNRTSLYAPADDSKHAALIERTRKSMAGFEAAQKNAQLERRRSMKDAKKKQRESSYFPRLEEEEVAAVPGIDKQELIEGDPDYESVFMSRPKIKTSPAVSPTRSWGEEHVLDD
ncbi:hypothetical protein D0Z07_4289 [Hyphodiscus hymeniophilus]|uniref:HAUS augmin-like complex subunit 6 N-terminal domain-containing protein n=1 Tax=Hyphodiscus hymeniophilus TaxID=353542 RepID=A0A9P6VJR0_9HELO|nr:hypothetical protein D0Z07_4289 [Hyphodiscus hymeniophilus]